MYRIFITIPTMRLIGGIERVTSYQANYWAQTGNDVSIITFQGGEKNPFYNLMPQVRILNITVSEVQTKFFSNPIKGIINQRIRKAQYKKSFEKFKQIYRPDIVFTTMHGIERYFIKTICPDVPVVGINHISLTLRHGDYISSRLRRTIQRIKHHTLLRQLKKYDCCVALSRTDELMFKNEGCSTAYIPNPIDLHSIKAGDDVQRDKYVICVGRLDYLKGQDRLLRIWSKVSPQFPEWKLLLVGDGEKKEELCHLSASLGLGKTVVFTGARKDVYDILHKSSVFAFTSRTESFGMVLLEAFACGLPVVAYDCETGPRDLVQSYYNGFLVSDDDEEAFAMKLSLLMLDEEMRTRFGENAKLTARQYDNAVVLPQYSDLIQKLCQRYQ